jgi:hypothetical protein
MVCKGLRAESLHNLLMREVSALNAVEYEEEEEEEEGFVDAAKGEYNHEDNEGLESC